jgi:antitoxin (DNA-binding transcriptional repressor) of toxin-antitoxin stability system
MKRYTYSAARQRLAELLEEASRDGEVQIRRQDGRIYAVTPVAPSLHSPFASVTGGPVNRLTSKELLRLARQEGQAPGERTLRSTRTGRLRRVRPHSR